MGKKMDWLKRKLNWNNINDHEKERDSIMDKIKIKDNILWYEKGQEEEAMKMTKIKDKYKPMLVLAHEEVMRGIDKFNEKWGYTGVYALYPDIHSIEITQTSPYKKEDTD